MKEKKAAEGGFQWDGVNLQCLADFLLSHNDRDSPTVVCSERLSTDLKISIWKVAD